MAAEIANVARTSFRTLFENGQRYYYCTLFTTGEGHAPSISASSFHFRDLLYSPMGFMLRKKCAIAIVLFT
ncbi:DUF4303 domain-containing protein [Paenibacillus polymyxa]|uniref:DUF4303 domain-containing protein n=1 Tax=Paenibacillus polymyxa TaxID=1406 RepID=UPI0005C70B44|nr:DUF4303 domain-containing protein [Paenibacillus polymyxa]AJW69370.1 hypothetical protein PPE_06580 [Paenibacillus polymyxa E681]